MLLVEQNAHAALELASRAYVLEMGRIVLEGTDLLGDPRVRAAYLGEIETPDAHCLPRPSAPRSCPTRSERMAIADDYMTLTRVGPGTPMGKLLRRYWIPALMSRAA